MKGVKLLVGGAFGYFIAALFNSILVVIKETNEAVHDWLADVLGHHWIGHGILTLVVFFVFTFLVSATYRGTELSENLVNKLIMAIFAGTILSIIIIAGFFVAHF
jgi:Fe2+ transport system protein B